MPGDDSDSLPSDRLEPPAANAIAAMTSSQNIARLFGDDLDSHDQGEPGEYQLAETKHGFQVGSRYVG